MNLLFIQKIFNYSKFSAKLFELKKFLCTNNFGYINMQDNEYADNKTINGDTIYVADIPIKIDQNCKPCQIVDEYFFRQLFCDHNIIQSPNSVIINVDIYE